jgi:hypothetical protein
MDPGNMRQGKRGGSRISRRVTIVSDWFACVLSIGG